jgi:hypothetical protein
MMLSSTLLSRFRATVTEKQSKEAETLNLALCNATSQIAVNKCVKSKPKCHEFQHKQTSRPNLILTPPSELPRIDPKHTHQNTSLKLPFHSMYCMFTPYRIPPNLLHSSSHSSQSNLSQSFPPKSLSPTTQSSPDNQTSFPPH